MTRAALLLSGALLASVVAVSATRGPLLALPPARATSFDDLAKQAYRILKTNCFECHGALKRGGLDMRTPESITAGGTHGKVIVAHDPDKSPLYLNATYEREIKMPPPPRGRIADADLDIPRQWIEAGGSLEGVEAGGGAANDAEELKRLENRPIKPRNASIGVCCRCAAPFQR
jgi:mono/diheme cytochrome c family protein